jgi:hypothetical protein
MHDIPADRRSKHETWLREVTVLPTAAGHEGAIVAWIDRWLETRDGITRRDDPHGNIELSTWATTPTAHPSTSRPTWTTPRSSSSASSRPARSSSPSAAG